MLQSFSWSGYFILAIGLTIVYYCFVLVLYYRNEVKGFFKNGFTKDLLNNRSNGQLVNQSVSKVSKESAMFTTNPESESTAQEQENEPKLSLRISEPEFKKNGLTESDNSRLFSLVHDLMNEIGKVLKTAAHKHYMKEELITALQMIVSRYPMLKDTAFERDINDYVAVESSKLCSVFLEDSELDRLWKKGR